MSKDLVPNADFDEIAALIAAAKQQAFQAVNTSLIELYWQVGEYISRKIENAVWGDGVVSQLAGHLAKTAGLEGFHPPEPVPNAAVLRDLPRRRNCLTTGETIALDP